MFCDKLVNFWPDSRATECKFDERINSGVYVCWPGYCSGLGSDVDFSIMLIFNLIFSERRKASTEIRSERVKLAHQHILFYHLQDMVPSNSARNGYCWFNEFDGSGFPPLVGGSRSNVLVNA